MILIERRDISGSWIFLRILSSFSLYIPLFSHIPIESIKKRRNLPNSSSLYKVFLLMEIVGGPHRNMRIMNKWYLRIPRYCEASAGERMDFLGKCIRSVVPSWSEVIRIFFPAYRGECHLRLCGEEDMISFPALTSNQDGISFFSEWMGIWTWWSFFIQPDCLVTDRAKVLMTYVFVCELQFK